MDLASTIGSPRSPRAPPAGSVVKGRGYRPGCLAPRRSGDRSDPGVPQAFGADGSPRRWLRALRAVAATPYGVGFPRIETRLLTLWNRAGTIAGPTSNDPRGASMSHLAINLWELRWTVPLPIGTVLFASASTGKAYDLPCEGPVKDQSSNRCLR